MKFLLDESTEFRLAAFLKEEGHDVTAVAHDYPRALSDREVLAIAQREQRILITNDRDFGELIYQLRLPHAGVVFFRLGAATLETKIAQLNRVLTEYAHRLDQFLVITDRGVRIRRTHQR